MIWEDIFWHTDFCYRNRQKIYIIDFLNNLWSWQFILEDTTYTHDCHNSFQIVSNFDPSHPKGDDIIYEQPQSLITKNNLFASVSNEIKDLNTSWFHRQRRFQWNFKNFWPRCELRIFYIFTFDNRNLSSVISNLPVFFFYACLTLVIFTAKVTR